MDVLNNRLLRKVVEVEQKSYEIVTSMFKNVTRPARL